MMGILEQINKAFRNTRIPYGEYDRYLTPEEAEIMTEAFVRISVKLNEEILIYEFDSWMNRVSEYGEGVNDASKAIKLYWMKLLAEITKQKES